MMRGIRKLPFSTVVLGAFLAWAAAIPIAMPAYADTITVSQWSPGVVVDSPIGYDVDHWFSIENPCHRTLHAQVGNSASSGTIDFAWAEQFGTFLIQSQQVAAGESTGTVRTSAPGSIRVAVSESLFLHIDAAWSYSLPADFMMTQFGVGIAAEGSPTAIFNQHYTRWTFPGEPSSGTLPIQGDVILTPGETWLIQYYFRLEADAGPSLSAAGNGYVSLLITPEASTLALLAPLLLVRPRRATCRRAH